MNYKVPYKMKAHLCKYMHIKEYSNCTLHSMVQTSHIEEKYKLIPFEISSCPTLDFKKIAMFYQ